MTTRFNNQIPAHVLWVLDQLQSNIFEAFIVGGCVRDLLLKRDPNDWDVTTNATPDQIIEIFEKTEMRVVYENDFGTVAIVNKELEADDPAHIIEITPYRTEGSYSDNRRPDEVSFAKSITEDLSRRDFTINAMAYNPDEDLLVDEYGGQQDLKDKVIRTVGDAHDRFSEDALRMMRALRFSAQLGFALDDQTIVALRALAGNLKSISKERIRDELLKLLDAKYAMDGVIAMEKFGLLEYILPELQEGIGCDQGGVHAFDVWTHLLKSLEHGTKKEYPLYIKIAALFHDIGKPRSRRAANGRGTKEWTFYGHEVIGAKMVKEIGQRLKFPKELTQKVEKLVRYHMFFSDPDAITLSAVRRMVKNVGADLIWSLMDVRTCDRIGTGRPKEKPYRLRKYHAMIEEVMRDPISVGMLKLNGDIMLGEMGMSAGKRIGWILHALLEEVLDDPKKNTRDYLEKRALEMDSLDDTELQKLGEAGKEKKDDAEFAEVKKLHRKHQVD